MTGKFTGPYVQYEVWNNGKNANPQQFLSRRTQCPVKIKKS